MCVLIDNYVYTTSLANYHHGGLFNIILFSTIYIVYIRIWHIHIRIFLFKIPTIFEKNRYSGIKGIQILFVF